MLDAARPPAERHPESGSGELYATPRQVSGVDDCLFYHTMDLPGHGTVQGCWDLRDHWDEYLGGIELHGKRVLELGTASGDVCFYMERQGAEVVAFDLAPDRLWDFVPSPRLANPSDYLRRGFSFFKRLHNSYWFAHHAHRSRARVVHGGIYEVPGEIGPVDVCTYGCILLHLRDPFLALANGLRLTRERVIITQPFHGRSWENTVMGRGPTAPRLGRRFVRKAVRRLLNVFRPVPAAPAEMVPCMGFLPDSQVLADAGGDELEQHITAWWFITPQAMHQMVACLGFERTQVTYHEQLFNGRPHPMYTLVADRTQPMPTRIDGSYPWW